MSFARMDWIPTHDWHLLGNSAYGDSSIGWSASLDSGCSLEDLTVRMDDRNGWCQREREREREGEKEWGSENM